TAQSKHYPSESSGYVFDHCEVTSDPDVTRIFLGRPWRAYSTVIFLNSKMDAEGGPAGWSERHAEETHRREERFYAEYQSIGPGAIAARRESHSKQLSAEEAQQYSVARFLADADGWDPARIH